MIRVLIPEFGTSYLSTEAEPGLMSAEDRVSVKTRVPQYQKDAWQAHAAALDMSQSEYVRTMIQAGRRDFELEPPEPPSRDADPGGSGLETPVLEVLSADEYRDFDAIVDLLTEEIEDLIDDTLQELTAAGEVEVSGRKGYRLTGGSDGEG